MRLDRFCNNPACEECDVLLAPRQAFRKGGLEVCPACLEPLVVRPARPRVRLRKVRSGVRRPPQTSAHPVQESVE